MTDKNTAEDIANKEEDNTSTSEKETNKTSEENSAKKTEEKTEENTIEKLQKENAELNDKLLRATADIQNIKRRMIEDRVASRLDGAKDLLLPITNVIDNLQRAFSHIPEDLKENDFIKSLQSIDENLNKALTEQGVEFFAEAEEIFDANLHDSMMIDPNTKKNSIAQVFEKGILFKGKVIRHAKVSVGSKEEK